MKKIIALVLCLLLLCSFTLAGCSTKAPAESTATNSEAAETQAKEPKILRFAEYGEPSNMDPHHAFNPLTTDITYAALEGLTRINQGQLYPGMAESWEVSEDGLTYTFHLRDAKWSDGKQVTAKDFEYSFLRLFNPDTHSDYGYFGTYFVGGEAYWRGDTKDVSTIGVKALDDKTLECKLVAPKKFFLNLMGWGGFHPVRQDYVEKYGDSYAADPEKQAYNGPFIIKEWKHEESLLLVKNPEYWDKDNIKLDEVHIAIVTDPTTVVNMYETGELDFAQLTKNDIPKYEKEGKLITKIEPSIYWYHFQVNSPDKAKKEFLSNINFRKAIGYAIDRIGIAESVLADGSIPYTRLIPPGIFGIEKQHIDEFPINEEYFPFKPDAAKANEYLDAALKELGKTKDQIPKFEILVNDKQESKLIVEATQDMILNTLGLEMKIRIVPSKQKWDDMINNRFDIVYAGWAPDFDDPINYLDTWIKGGGTNTMGWYNKDFEDAIALINVTPDVDLRAQTIDKAEKILLDEAMLVPIYTRATVYTQKDYLKNLTRDSVGMDINYVYADIQK